jgi:hypothetical protein
MTTWSNPLPLDSPKFITGDLWSTPLLVILSRKLVRYEAAVGGNDDLLLPVLVGQVGD